MKTLPLLKNTLPLLVLFLFLSGFIQTDPLKLTAETNHSTLMFSVPISNGITRVVGKFNEFTINMDYVEDDITQSSIIATIKAESLDTGIDGRDEHLRSSDFFETETYPEIIFTSTSIRKTEDGMIAIGTLDFHGVSKAMEIPLVMTGRDGTNTLGFSARFIIKRSDFNLASDFKHTSMENFIGDDIEVSLDFWTKKRKEKKSSE